MENTSVINKNEFLVKEHVGMFKAANNFDIYDLASNQMIMQCREPNLGFFTKILRFTKYKRYTPFRVEITNMQNQPIVTVRRGVSIFLSKVEVLDEQGRCIGYFKQKMFSIGGKFNVLDAQEKLVCTLKGKWTGWDFRFLAGEQELAAVSKKWAGLGKELLTSADNYVLSIKPIVPADAPLRKLILAAVMCIDMVLKE